MAEEITKYTQLVTRILMRLERIWEEKEGDLIIEVRSDKDKVMAKIREARPRE